MTMMGVAIASGGGWHAGDELSGFCQAVPQSCEELFGVQNVFNGFQGHHVIVKRTGPIFQHIGLQETQVGLLVALPGVADGLEGIPDPNGWFLGRSRL